MLSSSRFLNDSIGTYDKAKHSRWTLTDTFQICVEVIKDILFVEEEGNKIARENLITNIQTISNFIIENFNDCMFNLYSQPKEFFLTFYISAY